jgi:gluconokinase
VSFGEFATQRLTGQPGLSVSMASATGLLDQHTLRWDPEVLRAIELSPDKLSPIGGEERAIPGEPFATRWPALRGVPWLPAWGDGACSNVGSGCTSPERFALMVGTSGAERAIWAPAGAFAIPDGAWCYRVDAGRLVVGGALNDGGSLLDWLRRSFRMPSPDRLEAEVTQQEPDGHGLTVLPFWGGERSPGWADDARGAVIGLRLHTRPADILRAALEAVALRFAAIDQRLQKAHRALPSGR